MIPLVYMLPMRATCLVAGLLPFAFTHPFTQHTLLPALQSGLGPLAIYVHACVFRLIDNDNLEDRHWRTELREVELYENERWAPGPSGSSDDVTKAEGTWSKNHLKAGERKAWTRGRDGWSGVSDDGSGEVRSACSVLYSYVSQLEHGDGTSDHSSLVHSSNLTFSLAPGWLFVETEDWRPDLEGVWADGVGADESKRHL